MCRTILILLILQNSFSLFSQTSIDSLDQIISSQVHDTIRINAAIEKAKFLGLSDFGQAKESAIIALQLAKESKYKKGIYFSYYSLASMHYENKQPEIMMTYIDSMMVMKDNSINDEMRAYTYNLLGISHYDQHNLVEAIIAWEEARALLPVEDRSGVISNIGNIYLNSEDFDNAREYFLEAAEINEKAEAHEYLAINYFNLSLCYDKGDERRLEYLIMCEKNARLANYRRMLPYIYEQMVSYYSINKEFQLATNGLDSIKTYKIELGSESVANQTASTLAHYRYHLAKTKRDGDFDGNPTIYDATLSYVELFNAAAGFYAESLKTDKSFLDYTMEYQILGDIYNELGKFKSAVESYQLSLKYKDSMAIDKAQFLLKDFERNISLSEKRERELNAENERQKQAVKFYTALASAALFVLLAIGLWSRIRYVRKSNKELAVSKQKAEKSEAFNKNFLANMSHEIRTPMNAVIGMTNLVLDSELQKKQRSYLTKVKKSSDHLLYIINDILDLSKIEAGKMELEEIDFSLMNTMEQVKNTLTHKAEERGLELITTIDTNVPNILIGDPVRLNQVLINLVGNAIKFTEKGSVSINVKKLGDKIQFRVIDTGIGISKDKLKAVFENFGQAHTSDSRKYGGTGLGLSISQQLVALMGGTIQVESEIDRGTTFFFEIDIKEGDRKRFEKRIANEVNVDGSILDGLKILIADDNEYNLIVARDTLLSKAQVEIIVVENGQQALDCLDESIDVVLMDVQMPVLSGLDATKQIRSLKNKSLKSIPVIALTASVLRLDIDRCMAAGMDGYIPKPFKGHELIIGIAKVLKIELKMKKAKITAETSTDLNSQTVSNLDYLKDFCNEDETKIKKYIGMFLNSVPNFLDKLKIQIEQLDSEEVANNIHGFKTKFIMMGMTETKSLASIIENNLRSGRPLKDEKENLQQLIKQTEQAFRELG